MSDTKTCSKCGVEYPATTEYFGRQVRTKDGLRSECKACRKQVSALYYVKNADKIREQSARYYAENPDKIREYYAKNADKLREKGVRYHAENADKERDYRARNADKIREKNALYYAENADKLRQQRARYYAKNADKLCEKSARYSAENPDKIREKSARYSAENADKIREYRARNADKMRAQSARRRARKNGLPIAPVSERLAHDYFNGCCAVCGRPAGLWHTLAMDHWIPVTDPRPDNPGTVPMNIIPLCHSRKGANGMGSCNLSKGNKDPEQWLIDTYGKRKAAEISKRIHAYFEWVSQQEQEAA